MKKTTHKSGRGGARPGAGRPEGSTKPNKKRPVTVRLSPHIIDFLKSASGPGVSQADLIEKALTGFYKI